MVKNKKPFIRFLIFDTKESTGNKVILEQAQRFYEKGYDTGVYVFRGNFVKWRRTPFRIRNFLFSFFEKRPDILVSTFWPTTYLIYFMRAKNKFFFAQEWEEDFYHNFLLRFLARLSFRFPFEIIVISDYLKKRVEKYLRNKKIVHKVDYAVLEIDILKKHRRSRDVFKIRDNSVRILSVMSWYNIHKAPDLLVDAIHELKKTHPKYFFTLVSAEDRTYSRIFDHFVSKPSRQELYNFYLESDILLVPSRSEGFFIPGLEAMAFGCLVIANNCKGILDYAINNYNAVILDNFDDLWKNDMIEKTIKDKKKVKKLIRNGYKTIAKYSSEYIIDELEKIYQKAVQ